MQSSNRNNSKSKFYRLLIIYSIVIVLFLYIFEAISYNFIYGDYQDLNFKSFNDIVKVVKIFSSPKYKNPQYVFVDDFMSIRFENPKLEYNKKYSPILLLGCSYTYGQGIKEDERFLSQLQRYTNRKIYAISDIGMEPDHLLRQLVYLKEKHPEYNGFEYIIFTVMYHHLYRVYAMDFFSEFMTERHKYAKEKSLKNKIIYYLDKFYTFKLIYNKNSLKKNEIYYKKIYQKWIMNKFNKYIKENYSNAKFVLLLYDDVTNSDNDEIKDFNIATLNPDYWINLQNDSVIVISTKQLVGDVLYKQEYQILNDKYQYMKPHHPNEKAWELIVPALAKKLNI